MNLDITFRNEMQEKFFWSRMRNNCCSGGFGNGKSYIGCLRAAVMLLTFPNYRMVIAREVLKDLRDTTMKTFFKIVPPQLVKANDKQAGTTELINGSTVLWKHLDAFDEQSMRGLEINSALLDQAEEIEEAIYLILDSRVGRWDKAVVPQEFLDANSNWPRDLYGNPRVPNFMDVLCNPDSTYHWIYRRYHPDSIERLHGHFYIEAPTDETLNDPATIEQMKLRDPEWVKKYFYGQWGASDSQIHTINPLSILEPNPEFIETLQKHASLYRVLDHGESSPTAVLWAAAHKGVYIFYREYYSAKTVVSEHRKNIAFLSGKEEYSGNYADPDIFRKHSQKDGGFWSVADEYLTADIPAPSLTWAPADNNELATRNRINELLRPSNKFKHPITGESPAPGIYFVKWTSDYPYGCHHAVKETGAQRRVLMGSDNGRPLYSDDRERSVSDHAYDCVRYFVSMHGAFKVEELRRIPRRSFKAFEYWQNRKVTPSPLARI